MKRIARAVLLVVLGQAVFAAPAHAGWRIERAKLIADAIWHRPCGGDVELRWAITDNWTAPSSDLADVDLVECRVTYQSIQVSLWPTFCVATIHEYGHLAGFRDPRNVADPAHSRNPLSVMHRAAFGDPRCAARGRPFLERVGLLEPTGH